MSKKNIIISEGNRPIWQLIIAAIHYTAIVSLLLFAIIDFDIAFNSEVIKKGINTFEVIIFLLPGALAFSLVKDVLFDLDKKQYKLQYSVGPIHFGKWEELPEIEYVSVFKQPLVDGNFIYEVNLWYQSNRHFNIYKNENKEKVFLLGKSVAKVLHVNLLDATVPNNYRWIKNKLDNYEN
ncbi:hypothetical protein [Maribacter hydrothermalis]|uniref:Uncharacterized protein n=1 Tax=Maribacter hydrothermalis TaxID=1836467 RepID=A0A1B7Z3Q7_9FLAO|nr:hypothetical protein [Maribacter hydrothermalis]APQ17084.1 hypothetical protein BTR34_06995 [Maribacter hydrothermalis]OBR37345.1 hypothetical protein A9200_06750 [Maribacter hydrothermalis]